MYSDSNNKENMTEDLKKFYEGVEIIQQNIIRREMEKQSGLYVQENDYSESINA